MAIETERNILVKTNIIFMISEVDLAINDTKKFEFLKKSKIIPIVNFRAKIGPINEIQNTLYDIYSESAHQELSEYVKKV